MTTIQVLKLQHPTNSIKTNKTETFRQKMNRDDMPPDFQEVFMKHYIELMESIVK